MLAMIRLPTARRAAMGAAGRARIEREFGEGNAVQPYLDALKEISRR
jgi:hypothetical protein